MEPLTRLTQPMTTLQLQLTAYQNILDNETLMLREFNHIVQSTFIQHLFNIIKVPTVIDSQISLSPPFFKCVIKVEFKRGEKCFISKTYSKSVAKSEACKKFFKFITLGCEEPQIQIEPTIMTRKDKQPTTVKSDEHILRDFNTLFQDKGQQLRYRIDKFMHTYAHKGNLDFQYEYVIVYVQEGKEFECAAYGHSKHESRLNCIRKFFSNQFMIGYPIVYADGQMETGVVGVAAAIDSVEKETIVTTDAPIETNIIIPSNPLLLMKASTSAIVSKYEDVTQRWFIISQEKLVAATPRTGRPWKSYSLPDVLFGNSNAPGILPFKQYKLARPEYEVKVKFNSNKFNQGKLVVSYLFQADQIQNGDLSTFESTTKSYRSLHQCLQRDHVIIDLCESNEVDLTIPFINTNNFVPIYKKSDELFSTNVVIDIHVLSPLACPDEAQQFVNCVLQVRMSDATFVAIQPAISEVPAFTSKTRAKQRQFRPVYADGQMEAIIGTVLGSVLEPVIGTVIDGATNIVGGIVNEGMSAINNLLSPIFGMLNGQRRSPIENMFGNIPAIPSLDKPADHSQPVEFRPNVVGDMAVAVRSEPKLSMRLDSTVLTPSVPLHFPGTNPVSVSELTQIWSYVDSFNWTTAQQTAGEAIYSTVIDPGAVKYDHTMLGYFAKMYTAYSGTLEFRFDIVGTQFHTGSLLIGFVPFETSPTEEEARCAYSKYCDVREQRQITFSVPFIDTNVLRLISDNQPTPETIAELGRLRVYVENSLVPIGSVTPSVEILVFVRAGPDFHFTLMQNPDLYLDRSIITADGQMDTGDKEVADTTSTFDTLNESGIRINIGEDHEMIPDVLKRNYKTQTVTITDSYVLNLNYPFISSEKTNPSAMISNVFRYKRGGECFTLVFEPIDTPAIFVSPTPKAISILPMTTHTYTPPANLPNPPSVGSFDNTLLNHPVQPSLNNFSRSSTSKDTTSPGSFIVDTTIPPSTSALVFSKTNSGGTSPYTVAEYNNFVGDLAGAQNAFSSNNAALNTFNTTCRGNFNLTEQNFGGIKNAMDLNVAINGFNSTVETSVNSLNTQVGSLNNNFNTNMTNTNTNNASLVTAIGDSGSSLITAVTPATIEIAYQPPNIQSNTNIGDVFRGLPSQLICTDINRTAKLYIPYYSLFNYQSWNNTSSLKKELLATTLGRLIFKTTKPVKMTVYWTAADDMYFCKIIGVPYNSRSAPTLVKEIVEADGQMDEVDDGYVLGSAGQVVEPPKIYSNFLNNTRDKVYNSFVSAKNNVTSPFKTVFRASSRLNSMMDGVDDTMSTLKNCANSIVEYLTSKFEWISHTGSIFSAILHLLQCFINPTLSTAIISITGIIVSLGLLSIEHTTEIISFITSKLRRTSTEEPHTVASGSGHCEHTECNSCKKSYCEPQCGLCSDLRPLFDISTCSTLGGLVIGAISAGLGLKGMPSGIGLCAGLFKVSSTFWMSVTHSVRFLKDFITLCVRAFKRLGFESPATMEAMTLTNDREGVKEFVEEAQRMLDQRNRVPITQNVNFKRRFWFCVAKAHHLQTRLIVRSQPETRAILALCDKVIKLSNELAIQATNCPVRYEPYVLALIGDSKVGKSFLLNSILPDLLADKGEIVNGELVGDEGYSFESFEAPVFTRTAGVEFWNGYSNQPAILYDDFLASTDPTLCARQVIEMYNLKSSAIMNCNMASLEDKNINANPLIVALAMNKMIVPNGITERQAFLRRKDSLWQVDLKQEKIGNEWIKVNREEYTPDQQKKFDHLRFKRNPDVTSENSNEEWIDYEKFLNILKIEMRKYHAQEKKNVLFRFEKLKVTLPVAAREMIQEADPFAIFYSAYMNAAQTSPVQSGMLPSEVITHSLAPLINGQRILTAIPESHNEMFDRISASFTRQRNRICAIPENFRRGLHDIIYDQGFSDSPIEGTCYICREDKLLERVCGVLGRDKHGMCGDCVLVARTNVRGDGTYQDLTQCGMCRQPTLYEITITGSYMLRAIRNLWRFSYTRTNNFFSSLFRNKWFWIIGTSAYVYMINVIITDIGSHAQLEQDQLLCKLFDVDFNGCCVKNSWGFTRYYPDGQMASDDEYEDSNEKFIEKKVNVSFFHRSQVYSPVPSVDGKCKHVDLLNADLSEISYEWNRTRDKEYGYWLYDFEDTRVLDVACSSTCPFSNEKRQELIVDWVIARDASIQCALHQLSLNSGLETLFVPPDIINPEFLLINVEERNKIKKHLMQYDNLSFWDRLCDVWARYGKYIKMALAAVAAIAMFAKGYGFCKSLFSMREQAEGHLISSGDFKTLKLPRNKPPTRISTASGQGDDSLGLAVNKIAMNTVFVTFSWKYLDGTVLKPKTICCRGLGLFGREAIFTKHEMMALLHFYAESKIDKIKDFQVTVRPFQKRGISSVEELTIPLEITPTTFRFTKNDLAIVSLPVKLPMFRDLTNLIATQKQHSLAYSKIEMIVTSKKLNVVERVLSPIKGRFKQVRTNDTDCYKDIESWNCYGTEFGSNGECGSIGIVNGNSPILAFHIAGNPTIRQGFALPLIREDFIELKKNTLPTEYWVPALGEGHAKIELEGQIWKLGTLKKSETPFMSEKTKIIPSLVQNQIEGTQCITQPGILSSRDPRYKHEGSPLKWGCMKHCEPPKELPADLIKVASDHYCSVLLKNCIPRRPIEGPLNMVTAIAGLNGVDYYDPIKLNTSSGWPYNLGTQTTKESLIQVIRDEENNPIEVNIHDKVLQDIQIKSEMRKRGIRPFTAFQDTLKDERRKASKLEKKDGTRIFSQSPLDYTIETRQYTLDFAASYMAHRHDLEHAVGINVNSIEWKKIVEKLMQKGNNIVSGDFSDYGPRMWSSLTLAAGNCINLWYETFSADLNEKEHSKIRTIMFDEIATCYHICNNLVYQVFCGIPSGHPLTVILNSMVHSILIRIAWLEIMKGTEFEGLDQFMKHVCLVVYGDDHLVSISNEIKELFNCQTLSTYLETYDFKYTDATKQGTVKYTPLKEASFLKCGFKPHETRMNQWQAPIDENSIFECAQWVFQSPDLTEATIENCDQSLRLAYGHGRKFFNDWKQKLNKALTNSKLRPLSLTWEECDEMFFGHEPLLYYGTYSPCEINDIEEEIVPVNVNNICSRDGEVIYDTIVCPSNPVFLKRLF